MWGSGVQDGTITETGIAETKAETTPSYNVVNINNDTARQWQPSANSQRRQAQHQHSNPANARISNVNAWMPTINGHPSTSNVRGATPRADHIPKPSRPDFTSQGNERNRRELQDSNGSQNFKRISPVTRCGPQHLRGDRRSVPGITG